MKTKVFYEGKKNSSGEEESPLDGMDFVAISQDDLYFFAAYRTGEKGIGGVPSCVIDHPDLLVLSVEEARERYDFETVA